MPGEQANLPIQLLRTEPGQPAGSVDRIRVLLAVQLMLIRQGISALLTSVDNIDVVGEVATAADAVARARVLHPNVVLLDQDIPDGFQSIRQIKESVPSTEVILITDCLDEMKALQAIEAGATGYVLKDIPTATLAAALRAVCSGRGFFHPEIARKLMGHLGALVRDQRMRNRFDPTILTERELEILIELAKGSRDREIAAKLMVAEGTVKTQIHRILRKLGVRNRTEAVAYVMRKGLID